MDRRTATAIIACAVLVTAGCAGTVTGTPSRAGTAPTSGPAEPAEEVTELPPAGETDFFDCTDQVVELIADAPGGERDLTFGCGSLEVPLDYREPDADTIDLFAIRVQIGGQQDRIGSLLVNPGGPGGSGANAAIGLALTLPTEVLERFDLVGFDPRGVGFSSPVECIPDDYKDDVLAAEPYVLDDDDFDDQVDSAETVAQMCYEEYGDELGLFNTVNTARDMDQLRESLGDDELSYLGYSYGTTLGSTYAELFPDNVRALVLDAAVNPTLTEVESYEAQIRGFESAFDAFAADCVERDCPAGDDPRATVLELLETAREEPIPNSDEDDERDGEVGFVLTAVISALYDQEQWIELGTALGDAVDGDAQGVIALADQYNSRADDGSYSNLLDANLTINCADTAQSEAFTEAEVEGYVEEWGQEYTLFGGPLAGGMLTCSAWEAPRFPLPERVAEGAPPIMVIGTRNDPATPYDGAVAMADQLESGFLVTWEGEGHTAYPKTDCITDVVNAYLIDLTVPDGETTCPPG